MASYEETEAAGRLRSDVRLKAMDLLSRREHSRAELAAKLGRRDYPHAVIIDVLDRLVAEGLQSDARFAEHFTHVRLRRGQGMVRIRAELRERGVDEALIVQALAEVEQDWMTALREAHRKRFGQLPQDARERARQARFLYYRGFTSDQVQRLFRDELRDEIDEDVI